MIIKFLNYIWEVKTLDQELIQSVTSMWPILLMGVIFYFLLYRPQKKEQKKRKEMLENLKKDAKIVTAGGIYGTIVSLSEETVVVRIAEKVEVKFSRSAISQILGKKNDEE